MRCGDRAVTAGLDIFLTNLKLHEASQLSDDVLGRIQILPGSGYRALPPARRRQWLEDTLAVLKGAHTGAAASRPARAPTQAAGAIAARPSQRPLVEATPRLTPDDVARLGVDAPVHALKRVPFALAVKFDKLGVHTVRDLLLFFPRRHADYGDPVPVSQLEFGREQTVRAHVWSAKERQFGYRLRASEATVGDATGMMTCVWFNQPWIAKQLPTNAEIVVSGRVAEYQGRPKFDNPEWEIWSDDLLHTGRLVPVYPLTAGLPNRTVRPVMREALDGYAHALPDPLPDEMRRRLGLIPIAQAVAQMHYPSDRPALEAARRRLAFEELLPIQLTMLLRRR
ncbi:MAG: DNA helicase RecG, partial [Dehalococcoidia bacterium]|nr:DNA helicase RecG [Dehalococcoidia bacterium]